MIIVPPPPDPRMLRVQLGIELRRLREEADRSTFEAAAALGCKQPKISKIESGSQSVKPDEVRQLLDFYSATAKHGKYLLGVAEKAARRNRHKKYHRDAVPDWFQRFLALESAATDISSYEVESVSGLLQTPEYARAVIRAWEPATARHLLDQQVQTRMERQHVLTKAAPLNFTTVLSEAALRRKQGSEQIMRDQLRHLVEMSTRSNIDIRVLPFDSPRRIAVASAVVLLQLTTQRLSAVYLEDVLGATYLHEPEEFTRYSTVFERLHSASLPEEESRDFIAKVAEERT